MNTKIHRYMPTYTQSYIKDYLFIRRLAQVSFYFSARSLTCICAHIPTYIHIKILTRLFPDKQACAAVPPRAYVRTYSYAYTHNCIQFYILIKQLAQVFVFQHLRLCAYLHTYSHAYIHTNTYTQVHTHTHTYKQHDFDIRTCADAASMHRSQIRNTWHWWLICMCVCMYVCMYVYIYICLYFIITIEYLAQMFIFQ
jgi:hypothetical protein